MSFSDPERNIAHLNLQLGMRVADFGAGSGHYALALARRVGSKGRVYAVDVRKELLERLRGQARERGFYHIEFVWGNLDRPNGTKLAAQSVDAVVISNMLFQSENKVAVLREAERILKPEGKLLVIDWSGSLGPVGPRQAHVLTELKARELAETAGFTLVHSFNAGDHHYGLLYQRA